MGGSNREKKIFEHFVKKAEKAIRANEARMKKNGYCKYTPSNFSTSTAYSKNYTAAEIAKLKRNCKSLKKRNQWLLKRRKYFLDKYNSARSRIYQQRLLKYIARVEGNIKANENRMKSNGYCGFKEFTDLSRHKKKP